MTGTQLEAALWEYSCDIPECETSIRFRGTYTAQGWGHIEGVGVFCPKHSPEEVADAARSKRILPEQPSDRCFPAHYWKDVMTSAEEREHFPCQP